MRSTRFTTLFGYLALTISTALAQATTTPPGTAPAPPQPQAQGRELVQVRGLGLPQAGETGGGSSSSFWSWLPRSSIAEGPKRARLVRPDGPMGPVLPALPAGLVSYVAASRHRLRQS